MIYRNHGVKSSRSKIIPPLFGREKKEWKKPNLSRWKLESDIFFTESFK